MMSDPRHPWGCLATQAAVTCGDAGQSVRKKLTAIRADTQAALRARFARAKAEGDLPKNSNPPRWPAMSTLVLGISMQAASGMKREELLRIVENTLRAWPTLVKRQMKSDLALPVACSENEKEPMFTYRPAR
jgi:hypothetical protein